MHRIDWEWEMSLQYTSFLDQFDNNFSNDSFDAELGHTPLRASIPKVAHDLDHSKNTMNKRNRLTS